MDRKEVLNEAILKELTKIRHDLNIVYTILLIWFIFWILGIFVSLVMYGSIRF